MSHFAYVRSSGTWATLTDLHAGELQLLDRALFKAINGDDGGTWAPSAVITIGGAGVSILITGANSELQHGSTFNSHGDWVYWPDSTTEFQGIQNYHPGSTTNFLGLSTVEFFGASSTVFFAGSTLQFEGALTSNGGSFALGASATFRTSGLAVFSGGLTDFNGALVTFVGGAVELSCPTDLNGHTTLSNDLVITGAGGVAGRTVSGVNADHTYSVSVYDVVLIRNITANRTYYLDDIGAINGKRFRFMLSFGTATGFNVTLRRSVDNSFILASAFLSPWLGVDSGEYQWVDVDYIDGRWEVTAFFRNP